MAQDLLKPTVHQIKVRNREWAKDLQKNKKKAVGQMRADGGRCCLAVAENTAIRLGLQIPRTPGSDGEPHENVYKFFGWDSDVTLQIPHENETGEAASLNDGTVNGPQGTKGLTHKQIAECVLNTYVHPSKKKWTYKLEDGKAVKV